MSQSRIDTRRSAVESQRRKVDRARDAVDSAKKDLLRAEKSAGEARTESSRKSRQQTARRAAEKVRDKERDLTKEETELSKRERSLSDAQKEHDKTQEREHKDAIKRLEESRKKYEQQRVGVRNTRVVHERIWGSPPGAGVGITSWTPMEKLDSKQWDAFLSHASEDKGEIVDSLASELQKRGVSVWYDRAELRIGDSLREKIDEGLAKSSFGIVVLSPNFFSKQWPRRELDGLTAREDALGRKVVLPIWHHISRDEVTSHSPTLAGIMAGNTGVQTVEEIAEELASVILEISSARER